jgi:predicted PurR-regulated permease PerM
VASSTSPQLPPGERLRRVGVAAWSAIGILILAYLVFQGLIRIKIIFPPLVLALIIIYILNPFVSRLERRGVSRLLATLLAYVVVLGTLTLLISLLVPFVSNQAEEFGDDWPKYRADIVEFVDDAANGINDRFGTEIDTAQVSCLLGADEVGPDAPTTAECNEVTRDFRDRVADQADRITSIGLTVLEVAFVFILAALLALYLLIDLPQLQRDLLNLVPESQRAEASDLGSKVGRAIGGFFRGQLLVALLVGLMASLGFWIIDLPFWLLIGAIAGFTNLIPLVGPFVGGGLGALVGIVTDGIGLGLQAALVALIVQQIDNHFISPNILSRTVNLHPVTVMLSILAGGTLAGFWGVLLGVPTVAVVKILLGHLWVTRVLGAEVAPQEGSAPGIEPPSVVPEP